MVISLIVPIIEGMGSFLVIFGLYMVLFAIIKGKVYDIENATKSDEETEKQPFFENLQSSYKLGVLGDFFDFKIKDASSSKWVLFCVNSIIQQVVMLNLLIAIISDTFD